MAETVETPLFGGAPTPQEQLRGLANAVAIHMKNVAKLFPPGTHVSLITRNPQIEQANMVFSTEGENSLGNILKVVQDRMNKSNTQKVRPQEGLDAI